MDIVLIIEPISYFLFFVSTDGLTDCEDPECCDNPVCQKSQLCHTVPRPIDILLRKQPPSLTASFFERMKFIIEDKGLQSYVQRAGFNERFVKTFTLLLLTTINVCQCLSICFGKKCQLKLMVGKRLLRKLANKYLKYKSLFFVRRLFIEVLLLNMQIAVS